MSTNLLRISQKYIVILLILFANKMSLAQYLNESQFKILHTDKH